MIPIRHLEIHVTHSCNLACQQCAHYSNHKHTGNQTTQQIHEALSPWSPRLSPKTFALLGGEPTLNPDLCTIILITRAHWPKTKLQLISNGLLLHRHPDLPRILAETGTSLDISIHHKSTQYLEKIAPVKELISSWQKKYDIQVNWRESSDKWLRTYMGDGKNMKPYPDEDARQSWTICQARWCPQIHNGHLWKCPQLAYLPMQLEKMGLINDPDWAKYLAYSPLPPTCTDQELETFINKHEERVCTMCPAHVELFNLPNPIRE